MVSIIFAANIVAMSTRQLSVVFTMILLHAPETAFSHGWCCIPDPCPPSMTAASTKVTVVTPTMTSQSVTTAGTTPSATRPLYSDWTAWSCTESCGGCGVERRSRICLSAPLCIEAVVEFNNQSCNKHPCPFGKRTCCGNYQLGQSGGRFACLP